jgi:hypothetical protein
MNIAELQAYFIRYDSREELKRFVDGERLAMTHYAIPVDTLAEAQGLHFLCPKCFQENGNTDVGTHWCSVSFADRGVTFEQGTKNSKGEAVRWTPSGNNLTDLSLIPSILLEDGCNWHGHIINGEAR